MAERKKMVYFGGKQGVSSNVLSTRVLGTRCRTPAIDEQLQNDSVDPLLIFWKLK